MDSISNGQPLKSKLAFFKNKLTNAFLEPDDPTKFTDSSGNDNIVKVNVSPIQAKRNISETFLRFFLHTGILSFCLRILIMLVIPIGSLGAIVRYFEPHGFKFARIPIAAAAFTITYLSTMYIFVLSLLHVMIVFCHRKRLFYTWSFIHYISELEYYIAFCLVCSISLFILAIDAVQAKLIIYVFENSKELVKVLLGFLTIALISAIIFAVKRHYIAGLALSFNYTNYKTRIQDCIFGDRIISLLLSARLTYKFRQKWRQTHLQLGAGTFDGMNLKYENGKVIKISSTDHTALRVRSTSPRGDRIAKSNTIRSVMDLFGNSWRISKQDKADPAKVVSSSKLAEKFDTQSPTLTLPVPSLKKLDDGDLEIFSNSESKNDIILGNSLEKNGPEALSASPKTLLENDLHLHCLNTAGQDPILSQSFDILPSSVIDSAPDFSKDPKSNGPVHVSDNKPTKNTHNTVPPSTSGSSNPGGAVADYLTESDKKRQFTEFFRLANKMIARFSNISEYRIELHTEAVRLGDKLYRYLLCSSHPVSGSGAGSTDGLAAYATGTDWSRSYVLGRDMHPYIEDEYEFRHAVALLKRHSEGGIHPLKIATKDFEATGGGSGNFVSRSQKSFPSSERGADQSHVLNKCNTSHRHQKQQETFSGSSRQLGSNISNVMSLEDASDVRFTREDLIRAVEGILVEIYVTAKSLQTIETALDKVDLFLTALTCIVVFVIGSVVVGDAERLLVAMSAIFSGAAFAFGTSARNMFESMIFLLVIHPFDVGDRVFIPLGTGGHQLAASVAALSGVEALDNLVIVEMHLLSTVFERWDGVRLYVPNYVLASKPIFNVRRSGSLLEIQFLQINASTSPAKIEALNKNLDAYVRGEGSTDFLPMARIVIDSIESCNRMNLSVIFQHSGNWQDMDAHLARRSRMVSFLRDTIDQLEITYMPPIQRVALVGEQFGGRFSSKNDQFTSAGERQRIEELSNSLRFVNTRA